jgi:peptidoglycan hydrolase CwlO-like protein
MGITIRRRIMSILSNASMTKREVEREIESSKFVDLLQDARDTIEALMEEVHRLEDECNDKDEQIKDLQDAMDEMERNNE